MSESILLSKLPANALVQILNNGDYDGCDREVEDPIAADEFIKDYLYYEDDEDDLDEYMSEWEYPDGEQTHHLLTIINGKIVRVVGNGHCMVD